MHKATLITARWCVALMALAAAAGCRTGRDYPASDGPRYAGAPSAVPRPAGSGDTLRVVTFNIAFARNIDSAVALLRTDRELRDADVLLLQEMDADGTKQIAEALEMWYVYYPAIYHTRARKDFGNAILSRWPVADDAKIALPYPSRYAGTHRVATAATIRVNDKLIRIYSTHLGTIADVGGEHRGDQLRFILTDARGHDRVVVAGDMNAGGVGEVALQAGYSWPTRSGPNTTRFGRWDHIFVKGLAIPDSGASGTVLDAYRVSDHRPVWARVILR